MHFDSFSVKLVERHSIFLDGGNHRRILHLVADKLPGHRIQFNKGERRDRQ
jgi:hypothetical protein